jgi:hypothetical protein
MEEDPSPNSWPTWGLPKPGALAAPRIFRELRLEGAYGPHAETLGSDRAVPLGCHLGFVLSIGAFARYLLRLASRLPLGPDP